MKRLIPFLIICAFATTAKAQVPFFGTSPGKNNIYNYTQLEFSPGHDAQSIFIFTHYGITDRFSAGVEFSSGPGILRQGFNLKLQFVKQDYLNASVQVSTCFNLFDSYRFDHQNISLFTNGHIVSGLGYITNTYCNVNREGDWSANQYWYLTYALGKVTPFVGMTHSWTQPFEPDLTLGLGFSLGNVGLYAWSGSLFSGAPVFTVGFDYQFGSKSAH